MDINLETTGEHCEIMCHVVTLVYNRQYWLPTSCGTASAAACIQSVAIAMSQRLTLMSMQLYTKRHILQQLLKQCFQQYLPALLMLTLGS